MTPRTPSGDRSTRSHILDAAERMVQSRGFNGFSYADIAAVLAISKPALHYHFPSKAELGLALVQRYEQRFFEALATVSDEDAPARLEYYASLYAGVLREQRMCLCGMLAAEYRTLSEPMQQSVVHFFERNEAWLSEVLTQGQREHTLAFTGSAREKAHMIISCLEGALLVARLYGDLDMFQTTAAGLLAGLTSAGVGEIADTAR
ncbi:TetR/AcrR family transcriptional regulator [Nocardia sp. NPDC046473]|uniref:TetR/AcrR family transcriptional regulator n=1 Tax=Nocardia sp. NPDC046473 TaxID=3155733 RepID=UPI0033D30714